MKQSMMLAISAASIGPAFFSENKTVIIAS